MSQPSWHSRLDRFIHDPRTELVLAAMILISVILVIIEVVLETSAGMWYEAAVIGGTWITGIFTVELTIRYLLARHKDRFFHRYWLDIIAILPYPSTFPILHVLRMVRLFRAGIFLNRNLDLISPTLANRLSSQLGFLVIIVWVLLVGAVGIYRLEGKQNPAFTSLKDSLWWSFFSMASGEPIGGEPQTDAGRFITLVVILCGLTTFAVFTGVVSAVMVQRFRSALEVKYLELDELRDHIIICGWNRSVPLLIEELQTDSELKHSPIVIVAEFEKTPERDLKRINCSHLYFYQGDYTRIDVLESVGIYYASRAILLADATQPRRDQDRDARTVLASLTIEKLCPNIYTCAQLLDRENNVQLQAAGVEDVIIADELTGHLIATTVRNKGALDVVSELLTVQMGNQFYRLPVPEQWAGRSFWDITQLLKDQADAILVAVESRINGRRETFVNPSKDRSILLRDNLIILARQRPDLSNLPNQMS
jgi:voltage-gated potassium channel